MELEENKNVTVQLTIRERIMLLGLLPIKGSLDVIRAKKKLLEKLNLEKRNIYQTRHTFASNMLSNKENPLWVSQMLGHKTLNMTLEIYTKYIKEENAPRKTTFLDKNIFRFAQN